MRLGRKLSEGFAVDHDADAAVPAPVEDHPDRPVPVSAEAGHVAGPQPVGSGQPPTS